MTESQMDFFKSFFNIESEQELDKAMSGMTNGELQEFMNGVSCLPELMDTLEIISGLNLD